MTRQKFKIMRSIIFPIDKITAHFLLDGHIYGLTLLYKMRTVYTDSKPITIAKKNNRDRYMGSVVRENSNDT